MLGIKERTSDMQFASRSLKTRLLELLMDTGETSKSRVNARILGGSTPQMGSNFNKGGSVRLVKIGQSQASYGYMETRLRVLHVVRCVMI